MKKIVIYRKITSVVLLLVLILMTYFIIIGTGIDYDQKQDNNTVPIENTTIKSEPYHCIITIVGIILLSSGGIYIIRKRHPR